MALAACLQALDSKEQFDEDHQLVHFGGNILAGCGAKRLGSSSKRLVMDTAGR
jgi:hypothetical protein